MVSLIKASLLFFLLFNIIYVTSPMKLFRKIGQSSKSTKKTPEDSGAESDPIKSCQSELKLVFQQDSGLENFLHALLNLNERSFENNKQCLAKRYFDVLFDIFNGLVTDLPEISTPRNFCHHEYKLYGTKEKCILVIEANTGCEADMEGVDCIKHIYLTWKENDGVLPGTENLTNIQLRSAIRRKYGKRYRRDISDHDLIEALRRERLNPEGIQRRHDFLPVEGSSNNELLHDINDTTLLDEYERRQNLPEYCCFGSSYYVPFDKYYVTYLYNEMHDFGGSAFSDLMDFCGSLFSKQKSTLTIDDQTDPSDYDA